MMIARMEDYLKLDQHFVALDEDELDFLTDLAVNESQRWIEAVTRNKFKYPDFLESLEDGVLLCELVERIWPCYLQLDDTSTNTFARLYGQHNLEAFQAASEKIGVDRDYIFLKKHIHAPERYICTSHAQEAIQEALIRVTVTVYLLGCRAKDTPTYTGPQLDLPAFTQLFQHYLHHFHKKEDTLCNKTDQSSDNLNSFATEGAYPDLTASTTDAPLAVQSPDLNNPHDPLSEMPSQMYSEDSEYTSYTGKNGYEVYGRSKDTVYADSVGSSNDSACGSSSPSVDMRGHRGRSGDHGPNDEFLAIRMPLRRSSAYSSNNPLQFVKTKTSPSSSANPTPHRSNYIQVDDIKQKLKEDELEWQMNLNQWKSKRKSHLPEHDTVDHDITKTAAHPENVTTFPAMIAARMKEGKAVPSFLEYSFEDEFHPSHMEKDNSSIPSGKLPANQPEGSEKDSSSGISSPRSSRSLVSVSPTPLTYSPEASQATHGLHRGYKDYFAEIQPASTKKIICLKSVVISSDCLTDDKQKTDMEQQSPINPNVEVAYKPFTEKLAMFRKADTEEEVVNVDPEKCNYKELPKAAISLKDKLSLFERALKQHHDKLPSAPQIGTGKLTKKDMLGVIPSLTKAESNGGLSKLLSKDLESNIRCVPVEPQSSKPGLEKDVSLVGLESPERYLQEIDDLAGNSYSPRKPSATSTSSDHLDCLPPPPLPSVPPPPVIEKHVSDHEQYSFPPPPPPSDLPESNSSDEMDAGIEKLNHSEKPSAAPIPNMIQQEPSLRRMDSTKRIKTEILKRRSDYFGLKSEEADVDLTKNMPVEKPRPLSLHELVAPSNATTFHKPAQGGVAVQKMDQDEENDLERTQKEIVELLDLEEERWKKRDQKPLKTKEHMIATIVEEYKHEIQQEKMFDDEKDNLKEVREPEKTKSQKEPVGILKTKTKDQRDSVLQETKPINMNLISERTQSQSRLPTKFEEPRSKNVFIVDRVDKVTEERHLTGSFETTASEEVRSLNYMTNGARPPPALDIPPKKDPYNPNDPRMAFNLQHYRDHSDGGYSSGRSDPGNSSFNPGKMPIQNNTDLKPERPSMPSAFRSAYYTGAIESDFDPQAPSKNQLKVIAVRKTTPNANTQKHWIVHEAELRRLAESEDRQRQLSYSAPLQHSATSSPVSIVQSGRIAKQPVPNSEMMQSSKSYREIPITISQDYSIGVAKHEAQHTPHHSEVSRIPVQRSVQPVDICSRSAILQPQPLIGVTGFRNQSESSPKVHNPMHYYQPQVQPQHSYQTCSPSVSTSQISLQSHTNSVHSQLSRGGVRDSLMSQPGHGMNGMQPGHGMNGMPAGASSKRRCAGCGHELGVGAAMVVEHLQLYWHATPCFKCSVCGQRLGNGSKGADVHIRNSKLHCSSCSSDERGIQESLL